MYLCEKILTGYFVCTYYIFTFEYTSPPLPIIIISVFACAVNVCHCIDYRIRTSNEENIARYIAKEY